MSEIKRAVNYSLNLASRIGGVSAFKDGREWYLQEYKDTLGANVSGQQCFAAKMMFPSAYDTLRACEGNPRRLSSNERLKFDAKMVLDFLGGFAIPFGVGIAERSLVTPLEISIAYHLLADIVPDVLRLIRGRILPSSTILA